MTILAPWSGRPRLPLSQAQRNVALAMREIGTPVRAIATRLRIGESRIRREMAAEPRWQLADRDIKPVVKQYAQAGYLVNDIAKRLGVRVSAVRRALG